MLFPRYLVDFSISELECERYDVLVIGSGIAGLMAAINIDNNVNVAIITKRNADECATRYAQGGIAAVMSKEDSPQSHFEDTLRAGAGLNNKEAVWTLVKEGPERIKELIELGVKFDRNDGELALGLEGSHSKKRILHANGDATGFETERVLLKHARKKAKIIENTFAIDVLTKDGECFGAIVLQDGKLKGMLAHATILSTGGIGQIYKNTTNPEVATGDGIAMGYRAGAKIEDMEFVQFHPTALYLEGAPRFLISEAVRGEGAILRNKFGERFMPKYSEQAELAPRDVVSRAIRAEMRATKTDYIYLDITHKDAKTIKERFPTIYANLKKYGIDITKDMIPVAPAAHYLMGGVSTDLRARTSVEGLWACGECARTGVHGANRLASNSLLEGLVFGKRAALSVMEYIKNKKKITCDISISYSYPRTDWFFRNENVKAYIRRIMDHNVHIIRCAMGLGKGLSRLESLNYLLYSKGGCEDDFVIQNMLTVAKLVTSAALKRDKSVGAHYRSDSV